MLFIKNGLEVEVDNPVCYDLFVRQGWTPVKSNKVSIETDETVKVAEETVEDNQEEIKVYKKGHFNTMSVEKIKELAKELGYSITATKKADVIEEFLQQQNSRS